MPFGLVKKSLAILDKLEAEESLLAFRRIAMGTGSVSDKKTARQWMDTWLRVSEVADERPRRPVRTVEELRAKGIRVFGPKTKT